MADNKDIFTSTVVPIMDKVRDDLQRKQADEYERHSRSWGSMMAGAAGPDGGMASMDAYNNTILYTGEWNTKTVEDYIDMVKAELKKKGIAVDAVLEKKMIDHLIHQQMPKSTVEYILRKAAEGTIFYLPQRARTSSLQDHINKEAERQYNPSLASEITGNILSWAANAASTGGFGGLIGQTILDLGVEGGSRLAPGQESKYLEKQKDIARKEVAAANKKKVTIPRWMLTQMGFERIADATDKQLGVAIQWAQSNADIYRKKVNTAVNNGSRTVKSHGDGNDMSVTDATLRAMQYEAYVKALKKEQVSRKEARKEEQAKASVITEAEEPSIASPKVTQSVPEEQSSHNTEAVQGNKADTSSAPNENMLGKFGGWNNLLDAFGLSGAGDTFRYLGVTLANLPDMLLGVFTGRTKSIGLNKSTMMPLAALIGGSFIKNPLLKIPMMLYGGANLINKVGQESLAEYRLENGLTQPVRYKQYPNEELNPRISNPHVEGNVLIVDIDHVPRIVTMPPTLADAYQSGAIPLNTLANHILAKTDQMQRIQITEQPSQEVARHYEQNQEREQVKGIR